MRQPFEKPMYVYSFANLRLCGGGELVRVKGAHCQHRTGRKWETEWHRRFYSVFDIFHADCPDSSVKISVLLISQ
jgi:hypothetical protein